jgi:hypothetical protein
MSTAKPTRLEFIQHTLPALEPGEYKIAVTQKLAGIASQNPTTEFSFAVSGERFVLQKKEVVKVYPPAFTSGEYANALPHVVLRRRTLPWERAVATPEKGQKTAPRFAPPGGSTPPPEEPSWLALLVIDQHDPAFANAGDVSGAARQGTVKELYTDPSSKTLSYFTHAVAQGGDFPKDLLETGQKPEDPCQLIDIPVDLFKKIAPTKGDLNWLAHNQLTFLSDETSDSEVAIVMANRLPRAGSMSTVHLVSLEGMADFLPDSNGVQTALDGFDFIRLVSLYSWDFSAVEVKIHFAAYLENLNHQKGGDKTDSFLRRPVKSDNADVKNRLDQGYLAFRHFTRTGDQLVSWYRGPLIPASDAEFSVSFLQKDTFHLPVKSADALSIFDQNIGMFNLSYSAAWQLGRLLALSSQQFAVALYQWKTDLVYQTIGYFNDPKNDLIDAATKRNRQDYYKALTAFLADPDRIKQLYTTLNAEPALSQVLINWLGDLLLLKPLPFYYLVPDEAMLQKETLKFFRLDRNWLACLFDGAMSIGRTTDSQWAHDQAFLLPYFNQALQQAGISTDQTLPLTGFLLRSAAVKGWWPGIQAEGFSSGANEPGEADLLPRLRLDTLAPEILIGLINGDTRRINIHEAAQGTHFGISPLSDTPGQYQKELRYLSPQDMAGKEKLDAHDKPVTTAVPPIAAGRAAIDLAGLATSIKTGLGNPTFTSAEFALEMIEGVEGVGFRIGTASQQQK